MPTKPIIRSSTEKSIHQEPNWGSGTILSDGPVEARPQFQDPHILDRKTVKTRKFGTLTHREFQQYLTESQKSSVVHSDGFLSLSHTPQPPAYICPKCDFSGIFKSNFCARCGIHLLPNNHKKGRHK